MQVTPIPCLTDNYAYIINDNNSRTVGVVDPSEALPVVAFLKKQNLKLNYILKIAELSSLFIEKQTN